MGNIQVSNPEEGILASQAMVRQATMATASSNLSMVDMDNRNTSTAAEYLQPLDGRHSKCCNGIVNEWNGELHVGVLDLMHLF